MSDTKDPQEKPGPAHVEESAVRYELSEEEQPAMNFQTIMACIVRILGLKTSNVSGIDPDASGSGSVISVQRLHSIASNIRECALLY